MVLSRNADTAQECSVPVVGNLLRMRRLFPNLGSHVWRLSHATVPQDGGSCWRGRCSGWEAVLRRAYPNRGLLPLLHAMAAKQVFHL
jgi:hypothetical protein